MPAENGNQLKETGIFEVSVVAGIWRGKIEKTVEILEKTTTRISDDLSKLQTQVTKLVVVSGIAAFVGSAVVSIVVGFTIRSLTK